MRNQRRNANILQINSTNGIVEEGYVKIGGIDQWITIRGENLNNPFLLFIHGGPASPYSIFNPLLRSWEKYFTIVQWDQRGAGKTFRRNGKEGNGIITFNRLVQDGIELSEYLCCRFNQPKLILIGSSIGSLIGSMMVKNRPGLFYAYVGTDQNAPDTQYLSYKLAFKAFMAVGNKKGVQLLEKMGLDSSKWNKKDYNKMNQLIVKAMVDVPNMITDLMLPSMFSSPNHTISDIIDIFKGMNFSLGYLFDDMLHFDFDQLGTKFDIPFLFFREIKIL